MEPENDPRVYFAAERTLLAWVRTGVAVIGLGFIVARFGLFLQLVRPDNPEAARSQFSALLGSALVVSGGVFTLLAAISFVRFLGLLGPEERPRSNFSGMLALLVSLVVGGAGLILGVFLLL
jgi:putative membrane protein